jgi:hypothetical protein
MRRGVVTQQAFQPFATHRPGLFDQGVVAIHEEVEGDERRLGLLRLLNDGGCVLEVHPRLQRLEAGGLAVIERDYLAIEDEAAPCASREGA